jgi:hypothetical protein
MRAVHRHAQDARPLGVMFSGLPGAARALPSGATSGSPTSSAPRCSSTTTRRVLHLEVAAFPPTGRARDLARTLAELGPPARMATIAERFGHADQRPLSDARATLIAAGHLYAPQRGRVAFTVPGFDRWLAQRHDT